jgi:4-hydroxythreonine-4-phosphate dehydrogenase
MAAERPVAVTLGDPAGIGPEIVVKALVAEPERAAVVVGDIGVLERAIAVTGCRLRVIAVSDPAEVSPQPGLLHVIAETNLHPDVGYGHVDPVCGRAAYQYVVRGAELAAADEVSALVTAPIHKEALRAGGCRHPGHTEILTELAGVERVAMMLAAPNLRVVLASIHVSLRQAIAMLDVERELETIVLAHEAGIRLGYEQPRVAVAGLNPHAGENGMFGDEDIAVIAPAIERARGAGIAAYGPLAPDTVFLRAREGEFDVVVCQYHDQGLIPVKYLGLHHGVNVTLGLPYVRTSVDHGTAFDIAGTGTADERSLLAALRMAERLSVRSLAKSGGGGPRS